MSTLLASTTSSRNEFSRGINASFMFILYLSAGLSLDIVMSLYASGKF